MSIQMAHQTHLGDFPGATPYIYESVWFRVVQELGQENKRTTQNF